MDGWVGRCRLVCCYARHLPAGSHQLCGALTHTAYENVYYTRAHAAYSCMQHLRVPELFCRSPGERVVHVLIAVQDDGMFAHQVLAYMLQLPQHKPATTGAWVSR